MFLTQEKTNQEKNSVLDLQKLEPTDFKGSNLEQDPFPTTITTTTVTVTTALSTDRNVRSYFFRT